jgi:hypothetical protein
MPLIPFVWFYLWRETLKYVQKTLFEILLLGNKFQDENLYSIEMY